MRTIMQIELTASGRASRLERLELCLQVKKKGRAGEKEPFLPQYSFHSLPVSSLLQLHFSNQLSTFAVWLSDVPLLSHFSCPGLWYWSYWDHPQHPVTKSNGHLYVLVFQGLSTYDIVTYFSSFWNVLSLVSLKSCSLDTFLSSHFSISSSFFSFLHHPLSGHIFNIFF